VLDAVVPPLLVVIPVEYVPGATLMHHEPEPVALVTVLAACASVAHAVPDEVPLLLSLPLVET
jgi:hypothetical protein